MGKAYMKLGKTAEAGSAFRSAALDEANPNPAQALLNLGICFMALNRPADAVASYESAQQFHMNAATKNKLYANLGQAYTATGQMQQAVTAFEMALADKTYYLNDAASVDYQRAVGSVAQGTAVMQPVQPTGGFAPAANDMSGLDVPADGTPIYHETDMNAAAQSPYYYADTYGVPDNYASSDDRFFNASDEELEQWSRGIAKQDRKRRNVGLKILVTFIIIVVLVAAAGVFAYTQGYGSPTQQTVAQQLFADKNAAASTLFASDLSDEKIATMIDPVVESSNASVDGVDRAMNTSVVYVTVKTTEGGEVHYKVTMARSGIGWKIANVELYFPSQN
jgi:tetratricopeptide (TPR) repeat protein